VIYSKPELVCLAESEALKQHFDPALVCSLVEVLSGWNPAKMEARDTMASNPALQYENPEEYQVMSHCIGLMQFTGLQARALGYTQKLEDLLQPELNLEIGIKVLINSLAVTTKRLQQALVVMYGYSIASLIPKIVSKIKPYEEFLASPLRPSVQS
jgi:hypothetical protein